MHFRSTLVVFSILGIVGLMLVSVTENMVIVAHSTVSICTTLPGSACITTGKNPQECRATLPSCHTVTNRQAALDRRSEIINCRQAVSLDCKVIVKH